MSEEMSQNIFDERLKKWLCSFSGCDGGNPKADIWLCGIEWGYEKASESEREYYYKHELPNEVKNGEHKLNTNYNFFTDESMSYPFNLAFAKLYSAIQGRDVSTFSKNTGELLKLNLSPIPFKEDSEDLWSKDIANATGIENKYKFIEYLNSLYRFKSITEEYKPRLIVCIGNSYKNNFVTSFFGEHNVRLKRESIRAESSNKNQNNRYIHYGLHENTLIVIIPFSTSKNGLNSDYLLQKSGERIRSLLD